MTRKGTVDMTMAKTLRELRTQSVDQLIREHDEAAKHTIVGTNYFLAEIARRDATEQGNRIEALTRTMARLTWLIAALTVANVVLVALSLLID